MPVKSTAFSNLIGLDDGLPDEVVVYCPHDAEREFPCVKSRGQVPRRSVGRALRPGFRQPDNITVVVTQRGTSTSGTVYMLYERHRA